LQDSGCTISGAIVNNNDFPVASRKILLQYAIQRLFNKAFAVLPIDQNTDKWASHICFRLCRAHLNRNTQVVPSRRSDVLQALGLSRDNLQ
jgi:hypothetical protein